MKYIIDTVDNGQKVADNLDSIKEVLSKPPSYWNGGSGDSAINLLGKKDCLVFFKIDEGIYIENLPSSTAPLIKPNQEAKKVTHYVGGDPMDVPDICLCDEETAFKIISYFIENNGELLPDYDWVNIFDYIEDRNA